VPRSSLIVRTACRGHEVQSHSRLPAVSLQLQEWEAADHSKSGILIQRFSSRQERLGRLRAPVRHTGHIPTEGQNCLVILINTQ